MACGFLNKTNDFIEKNTSYTFLKFQLPTKPSILQSMTHFLRPFSILIDQFIFVSYERMLMYVYIQKRAMMINRCPQMFYNIGEAPSKIIIERTLFAYIEGVTHGSWGFLLDIDWSYGQVGEVL